MQVSFRKFLDERSFVSNDGSVVSCREVIVAWSELGRDGEPHEQKLLCTVMGRTKERLEQLAPNYDQPMEVELSFHVGMSRQDRPFNRITLWLPDVNAPS